MSNDDFIQALLDAAVAYDDNLKYSLFGNESNGYNSNSYINGLLHSVTGNYYEKPNLVTPGWNNPVPDEAFQDE